MKEIYILLDENNKLFSFHVNGKAIFEAEEEPHTSKTELIVHVSDCSGGPQTLKVNTTNCP